MTYATSSLTNVAQQGGVEADQRPLVVRQSPANKLSEAESQQILDTCNSAPFSALPPSQIIPILADQGQYLASESSFYRVLRADDQLAHRGKAQGTSYINKHEETGIIVQPDSPNELAKTMNVLLDDREQAEKYGQAARERYETMFSSEVLGKAYVGVYEKVLGIS